MTRLIVPALLLACALAGSAPAAEKTPVGRKVDNFTLDDYRGKSWSLDDFRDGKLVVVAFLGTECPLAKLYGPRLEGLAKEYRDRGVRFVGIDPNVQDSVTEIAAYAARHGIGFPILKDLGNKVADALGAARTPEVFVLDAQRVVRYHGRIDDQYGVGYVRDEPRRRDLQAALDELLQGKAVTTASTEPVGCLIGRVREADRGSEVTYTKQIARILQARCVQCHREGEIAPFALTKYDEVAGWAEMIAEVVADGRMPPWHADPRHGKFANEIRLTDNEKKLILDWVRAGAPEGDRADLPGPKQFVSGWQLPRRPDAVFDIQGEPFKVPAQGEVRYRYFKIDPGFTEDKWVAGAQIVPGTRAVVHHILAFAVPKNADGAGLRNALGEGGVNGFLAAYVPGQLAYTFPKGMAKKIPAGSTLVFQVHYTPIGVEVEDVSRIGFVFADPAEVTHEVKTHSAVQRFLFIPKNEPDYRTQATSRYKFEDGAVLLGFMPHMHLRGKSFLYEAVRPDGPKETLLNVPAFDFNWQTSYRLAEPLALPPGTRIHCAAAFDNSEDNPFNPDPNRTVRWGDQTWDEMMIGYFDVATPLTPRAGAEPPAPRADPAPEDGQRRQLVEAFFRTLDKDGDGKLVKSELPPRLAERFDRADFDGNGEVTLSELQRALAGVNLPNLR